MLWALKGGVENLRQYFLGATAIALALGLTGSAYAGGWTIIQAGTLLDQPGKPPRLQASVLIHDDKIAAVKSGFLTGADFPEAAGQTVRVIDLTKSFVMPGLIDCHVHISHQLSPTRQMEAVVKFPEDNALDAAMFADRTLQAGFTTVRDLGESDHSALSLRDAIEAGKLPGPSILAAGHMISITAGHGDVNGFNDQVTEALHSNAVCDGADACRKAVRDQIKRGADVIKIATTGGVLSQIAAGTGQQMFPDEIKAVVETAHIMGKKVAAHAHAAAGINAALIGGVDSIEHGSYLDDDAVANFKKTGAYLVPTLIAGAYVAEMAEKPGAMSKAVADKARAVGAIMQTNFGKAVKADVKVAFGTDTGVSPHGQNAREFKLLVKSGMTPSAALKSATVNAADLLDRSRRIGTLEAGKDADLIAVDQSPLEDISALESVGFVMRRGTVHRLDGKRQAFDSTL